MSKVVIEEESWVKKPEKDYDYAFKANVDILIDVPGYTLSDDDYSKIRKAIGSIRSTLSGVRVQAGNNLASNKKKEEKK